MVHKQADIVVAGAGQAGAELALAMRQEGFAGSLLLLGGERHLPYQRPPLSKAYLLGSVDKEALILRPQAVYDKARIDVWSEAAVTKIDRSAKTLTLANGDTVTYAKLALCTGGEPRLLEMDGSDSKVGHPNLHYLRSIADADRIHEAFRPGAHLVLIGGGYIGLEVASVARKRGIDVTVLEAMPRVLARVTSPEISAFYERVHREAGVVIRTDAPVKRLEVCPADNRIVAVICKGGLRVDCDFVIAGIGLVPNTGLAEQAGLAVDNGILVDENARTSDPDIYAAGDCTNHPNAHYGRRIRLESVPNALEQARAAAAHICGKSKPYNSVPWFWSDQYDLKLQMVGLSAGYDQMVIRGAMAQHSFAAFFLKEGRIIAGDFVNRPADFMIAKRLLAAGVQVAPEWLADESMPLKALFNT